MTSRYPVGSIVRLVQSIPRIRIDGSHRSRVTLEAGQQFEVVCCYGDYAGSPEYTLLDVTTGDSWPQIPEHCLELVTDTRPAGLFTS
jgi:hypothetical protein